MMAKSPMNSIEKAIDSHLFIPCVATGSPQVTYNWYFNANPIRGDTSGMKIHNGNLTIHKLMKHHQGFYQCLAQNLHGETLKTIYVTVVGTWSLFSISRMIYEGPHALG